MLKCSSIHIAHERAKTVQGQAQLTFPGLIKTVEADKHDRPNSYFDSEARCGLVWERSRKGRHSLPPLLFHPEIGHRSSLPGLTSLASSAKDSQALGDAMLIKHKGRVECVQTHCKLCLAHSQTNIHRDTHPSVIALRSLELTLEHAIWVSETRAFPVCWPVCFGL